MHAAHSWYRRLFTPRALPERVRVRAQEADADRQTALTIAISDDVLSAWRSVGLGGPLPPSLHTTDSGSLCCARISLRLSNSPQLHSGRRSLTRVHRRSVQCEASAYCCTQSLRMRAQGGHARKREYGAGI